MKNRVMTSSDELEAAALAASTRRAYAQDQRYFINSGGSLPATEEVRLPLKTGVLNPC